MNSGAPRGASMGRVIFVNRFYWPETPATGQLLTDVTTALADAGVAVVVLTSRGTTPESRGRADHRGVQVIRAWAPRSASRSLAGKALSFGGFWFAATWRLFWLARRGDTIVALTDPPLIGVAAWIIAWMKGAAVVHWAQDIYPEVVVAVSGRRWLHLLSPVRNASWRGARRCVALSEEMARVIAGAGVEAERIAVIPNWAPLGVAPLAADDPTVIALRRNWNLAGKFVVLYSGNLGRVHDLDTIVAAANRLRDRPDVFFVFVGDGAQRPRVEARVAQLQLSNVRFMPPQSRVALSTTLAMGDVHLVSLRPGCESFVFPSKLHGIAAAARPIVFVGPPQCELGRLVVAHGIGVVVANSDGEALAKQILDLQRDPARRQQISAAAKRFDHGAAQRSIAAWVSLLTPAHGT